MWLAAKWNKTSGTYIKEKQRCSSVTEDAEWHLDQQTATTQSTMSRDQVQCGNIVDCLAQPLEFKYPTLNGAVSDYARHRPQEKTQAKQRGRRLSHGK